MQEQKNYYVKIHNIFKGLEPQDFDGYAQVVSFKQN